MFSFICVWINGWINNREAGDLRRYRGHCDVVVMRPRKYNEIRTSRDYIYGMQQYKVLLFDWNCCVNIMDTYGVYFGVEHDYDQRPWPFIAICRVNSGGVLWVLMTSPSSMLVPDHCFRKGQHSTFDDSLTRSCLRGVLGKFTGNVAISMCVHTRLFCDWKL